MSVAFAGFAFLVFVIIVAWAVEQHDPKREERRRARLAASWDQSKVIPSAEIALGMRRRKGPVKDTPADEEIRRRGQALEDRRALRKNKEAKKEE
jgi:hypothetical protein